MMGRFFWLFTAACIALAVHLATVLYVPGITLQRNLAYVSSDATPNQFIILKPETQVLLVPTATPQDIVGLCLVDLSKGNVMISARVPASFWSFSVFGSAGDQVYGINDVEASTGQFNVELSKSKSLLQQVTGKPEAEDASVINNVGWHAEVSDNKAIAVLWVPVPDVTQRAAMEATLKASTCQPR